MGVGFDFGTTNSSLAVAEAGGAVSIARFPSANGATTESYRSLLYLERVARAGKSTIKSWSGPQGIEHYLEADEKGRLVQSLKSFLASRGLQSTEVFGRRIRLEELIARMQADMRMAAAAQFGGELRNAVVGRPVRFVGAHNDEDDDFAAGRLRDSLEQAGFAEVRFEYEPIAAAYFYESRLDHDELILIGDFGGGTSDFTLIRVGPGERRLGSARKSVLGNQGLGLAGDAFDAKIVRHLVSPALGLGGELRSGEKLLPIPTWVYRRLERWHNLSFLKSQETLNMLTSVERQAIEPARIRQLIYLVQHDLGYHLHQAVQRVKVELSHADQAEFQFASGDVDLRAGVTRQEFENWIAEELLAIDKSVSRLMKTTGIDARDVDAVFLTGGSSFVPAVRRIFEKRLGADKLRSGGEFTSVAYGLALKSLES